MNGRLLLVFCFLCACSLGLITGVDDAVASVLGRFAPALAWIAWIRIPSLVVCAILFVAARPGEAWRFSRKTLSWPVVRVALFWLVPAGYAVLVARVWVPALPRWIDVVAFLVTGLLAEELLFRGAIFQLANRILAERPRVAAWGSVLLSSVFFAAQHQRDRDSLAAALRAKFDQSALAHKYALSHVEVLDIKDVLTRVGS